MAKKADELIKLRNDGMAYALKIAEEYGVDGLREQVKLRGLLKVSVKFTPEELHRSIENISDRIYNNMLTMVYAVLYDDWGFREKRIRRFKCQFDNKVYSVGERDDMGHHWARFEDYAEEANRLYNLGIDMEKIREAQRNNDENEKIYIAAESAVKFLEEKGYAEAAEALAAEVFGEQ